MSTMLASDRRSAPRVIPEMRPAMAKADLRNPESDENPVDIGGCLDYARREVGWTLDQLAAELKRDPRQIRRWIANEENTQVHVVFAIVPLRQPFVIALARLAQCQIEVSIRARLA